MNNIISIVDFSQDYKSCFTTSEKIALFSGYKKQVVDNLIREHQEDFKLVTKTPPLLKSEGINGTKDYKTYFVLNRTQAMFLLTLMRNNEKIIKFKAALIVAFENMERELLRREETRLIGKEVRKNLTDEIQLINDLNENEDRFIKWSFSLYSDLIYKYAFNKTSKQLKIEKGVADLKKRTVRDFMTIEELNKIKQTEDIIIKYIYKNKIYKLKANEAYQKVKEYLFNNSIDK